MTPAPMARQRHHGIRKVCRCARRQWPKCPHSWYLNYKPKGRLPYRFSLDRYLGKHIATKADAEALATALRAQILDGTFRHPDDAKEPVAPATAPEVVTLDRFASAYVERCSQASGKVTWKNDQYMFAQLRAWTAPDGRRFGDWPIDAITEDARALPRQPGRRRTRRLDPQYTSSYSKHRVGGRSRRAISPGHRSVRIRRLGARRSRSGVVDCRLTRRRDSLPQPARSHEEPACASNG
jgi:hypothetical protein